MPTVQEKPSLTTEEGVQKFMPEQTQPAATEVRIMSVELDGNYDEVCSYHFSKPVLPEQYGYFNDYYEALMTELKNTVSGHVYDTASITGDIAHTIGSFSYTQEGDVLTVDYTVTIHYGKSEKDEIHTRTDSFDLAAGERLEETKS